MTQARDAAESPSSPGPSIAAILVTLDGYATIATTLKYLRAQTIANQVELVLVAPKAKDVHVPPEDVAALHSVTMTEVPDVKSLAVARMAGVRAASAPLVVFSEDHSFPEPGWAAALVDAHRRGYAGVAPQMKNANPDSSLSAAAMYLHFGGAVEPDEGFETRYPAASHNMSFSRAALLEVGDRLAELMLAEGFLHEELHRRGHRFWVEPNAVTRHVNMSRLRPALIHAWTGGRLYGGLRGSFGAWPLLRRIVYAGGSPLIPLLRLRRVLPMLRRTQRGRDLIPRVIPPMAVILMVHAIGEAAGYLFGAGRTSVSYSSLETHRERYVRPGERQLWS